MQTCCESPGKLRSAWPFSWMLCFPNSEPGPPVERMTPDRYHVAMPRFLCIGFYMTIVMLQGCGGGKPPVVVRTGPVSGPGFARSYPFALIPHPGDMEMGMIGDWVLENDQMRLVVSGAGLRPEGGKHDGNIIDAVPRGGVDLLREIFAFF